MQAVEFLHKRKENTGAQADEHHGKAGGDAPESTRWRTAVAAAVDDDMAWHGDAEFEDAAAQEPAKGAIQERVRLIRSGGAVK